MFDLSCISFVLNIDVIMIVIKVETSRSDAVTLAQLTASVRGECFMMNGLELLVICDRISIFIVTPVRVVESMLRIGVSAILQMLMLFLDVRSRACLCLKWYSVILLL